MQYEKGLISVVIPTYRRAKMITRAIDSVLNQTYTNLECIVVNDNEKGDEHSLELYTQLEPYKADPRFQFIEQEKHINGAVARNCGIRAAKGECIAFLDDDDYWEPEKLELQYAMLSGLDESWGAVSCLSRKFRNGELEMAVSPYADGNMLMAVLCRRVGLGTGTVLMRRTALDDVGYFDESLMRHQDLQLFACLAAKYKIGLLKRIMHDIDADDAQNRPSAEKLQTIKENYFRSIEDVMDSLSSPQRKRVFIMHRFECAYAFYRSGRKRDALGMALGIFKSPATLYMAIERVVRRIWYSKFRHYINRKYS